MKFKNRRQINKNLATNLPSPPHTGGTVATTDLTTIYTPNRVATKDTDCTIPIRITKGCLRLGCVPKGNKARISDRRVSYKSATVLPSETRIIPAPPMAPPIVTPSFINSIAKGPTINHEMRRVVIATYFLEVMDAPSPKEDG